MARTPKPGTPVRGSTTGKPVMALLVELEEPGGYTLSPLGRELLQRFLPLVEWSERWARASRGPTRR
jgi:hypothetical protein